MFGIFLLILLDWEYELDFDKSLLDWSSSSSLSGMSSSSSTKASSKNGLPYLSYYNVVRIRTIPFIYF